MIHFHQCNMDDIYSHERIDGIIFDNITNQEITHSTEINQEENRVSHRDPPIDSCLLVGQSIEIALDDQGVKSTLLYRSLNTNIGNTHENTVYNDETLGGGV